MNSILEKMGHVFATVLEIFFMIIRNVFLIFLWIFMGFFIALGKLELLFIDIPGSKNFKSGNL
jgi:hypothetical protein